jgi:long-chain fatty acid transport protein
MRRFYLLLPACLLLVASTASAGGFLIYEHGASATGMASARTASSDEPSALFYNPAAITELEGFQFQIGVTGILPYVEYDAAGDDDLREYVSTDADNNSITRPVNDGTNSTDAKIKGFNPIHLYATYNIESIGLTVGYGLTNPFGLGTYWPGDWDGRFLATETEIHTFFNQPTVAVDVAKLLGFKDSFKLSLAVGYNFVYGTARLAKRIDLRVAEARLFDYQPGDADPWSEMRMTGSAVGHGYNFALYAELPGWLAFGASVRSGISLPFSGNADFWYNAAGSRARAALASASGLQDPTRFLPDETKGDITIDLPWNMNFGIAFLGVENLKIEFDFYIAFFQSYDELDLQFKCVDEGNCAALADAEPIPKNWNESMQFSLAGEYVLFDALFLRAGYGIVTTPVPDETFDPSLPDGRRDLICFGAGYQGSWWKLDIGYMLAMWEGTKSHQKGNFHGAGSGLSGPAVTEDGEFVDPLLGNPEGLANGHYTTHSHLLALSFQGRF